MNLRHKYILLFGGFCLVLTLGGGHLAWRAANGALENELDQKLVWVAGAAAEVGLQANPLLALQPGDEDSSLYLPNRERLLRLLRYVDEAHIFRRDNTVIVTTDSPQDYPIGTPLRWLDAYGPELDVAWSTGEGVSEIFEGQDGRFYKYGFKRLEESDAMLTVLMTADYLIPLNQFQQTLLVGSLGTALLAGLIAAMLATSIARPLERLSRGALKIQRGRWNERVAPEGGVELGRLSKAMERMRAGIVQRDEQLRLMLAQVAHEIRNPLGGLELFATAAVEAEDQEERTRLLTRVRHEVQTLNEIINDFIAFSRPIHPHRKVHDIREPIGEAVDLVRLQLDARGTGLAVTLTEAPLVVWADPDHVKRTILNLLHNAGEAGTEVRLEAWWQNGEAVVSVRDNGPGVPKEARARIFDAFVTDKERGAGLGLAIVKRMVEVNGARVVLLDPEGGAEEPGSGRARLSGAEFRVYFRGSEEFPAESAARSQNSVARTRISQGSAA